MLKPEEKRRRTFSKSFKLEKVKELESKKVTVVQLSRIYEVSGTAIYNWIKLYGNLKIKGERMVIEKESESRRVESLLVKVKELEHLLGQKQVEIEYLKRIIDTESELTGVDIKKKIELMS
ncbi:MAG: transposase [Deltaproteobacteria bacterium]|nr:transposase [Deltaproteobacteria bacterium]